MVKDYLLHSTCSRGKPWTTDTCNLEKSPWSPWPVSYTHQLVRK